MSSHGTRGMIPRNRLPYSAIVDRSRRDLPGGVRVVLWLIVNVEDWDIGRAMPRQVLPAPTGAPVLPDVANCAWHEYGMRVGFWRLKQALDARGMRHALYQRTRVRVLPCYGMGSAKFWTGQQILDWHVLQAESR